MVTLFLVVSVFGVIYRIMQSAAFLTFDGLPRDKVTHVNHVAQFANVFGRLDTLEKLFGLFV